MSALRITIVGGTGFVGRHLAEQLLGDAHQLTLVARHAQEAGRASRTGIDYIAGDVVDPLSLVRAMRDADTVVNLVGAVSQPSAQAYFELHEEGARRVAEAAATAGAKQLVHVSALGVSEDAPSAADRSKAAGERAVRAAFPQAVILRPSLLFGDDDHFLGQIAVLAHRSPVIPLIGAATRVQPAHVDGTAAGIAHILERRADLAPLYQIGGTTVYTMVQLVRELLGALDRRRLVLPLPNALALPLAGLLELLSRPPFSREQVKLMDRSSPGGSPSDRPVPSLSGSTFSIRSGASMARRRQPHACPASRDGGPDGSALSQWLDTCIGSRASRAHLRWRRVQPSRSGATSVHELRAPAFESRTAIPDCCTKQGSNDQPELIITGVPGGTRARPVPTSQRGAPAHPPPSARQFGEEIDMLRIDDLNENDVLIITASGHISKEDLDGVTPRPRSSVTPSGSSSRWSAMEPCRCSATPP